MTYFYIVFLQLYILLGKKIDKNSKIFFFLVICFSILLKEKVFAFRVTEVEKSTHPMNFQDSATLDTVFPHKFKTHILSSNSP